MAAAQLNFDPSQLDPTSVLYDLYTRLYNGMVAANQVDAPDFTVNPPTDEDGEIDQAAISSQLASYSTILMQNSAYLLANSIIAAISASGSGGGSGGGGIGYVARSGDSMTGGLDALYGFNAGQGNTVIFSVAKDANNNKSAHVYGALFVDEDATVTGSLRMSNSGFYIGNNHVMYVDPSDGELKFDYSDITFSGTVTADEVVVHDISINQNGIFNGQNEYYHAGNSNLATVDWDMKDAHVYGDLTVDGDITFDGRLSALGGFDLGENNTRLLYSEYDEQSDYLSVKLSSDLDILNGYGLKFNGKYIVKVRNGVTNVVSFAAPGMVMNLGDSDGQVATTHIALQAAIKNAAETYTMVSQYGDGNFPNSFSAGAGNSGPTVMQTYYVDATDSGVVFQKKIRLGASSGPYLERDGNSLEIGLSYLYVDSQEVQHTAFYPINISMIGTTSLFRDLSIENSATVNFNTDAEFFRFSKPVEGTSFSIISETYKTRLIENALFFADSVFIEGLTGGMLFNGNAFFTGSLSSPRFASGFAGYGWAINTSELYGGYEATFDNLTIRKKMRVYELEVQKMSVTNGSLWVSDACSGDLVEEVV